MKTQEYARLYRRAFIGGMASAFDLGASAGTKALRRIRQRTTTDILGGAQRMLRVAMVQAGKEAAREVNEKLTAGTNDGSQQTEEATHV